jgi:hypothetical protein
MPLLFHTLQGLFLLQDKTRSVGAILALTPYQPLHCSPHSGAGIGLGRCGVRKVFIKTNDGHTWLVVWRDGVSRLSSPHSASSNCRQGGEGFGFISRNLSTSPALPATQLGRLDYLSNMGLYWKIWIRSTSLQEKEDLSLPVWGRVCGPLSGSRRHSSYEGIHWAAHP